LTELIHFSKETRQCHCGKFTHFLVENKCYSSSKKQDVIFLIPLCDKHRAEWLQMGKIGVTQH
jgi:hypothetical protein